MSVAIEFQQARDREEYAGNIPQLMLMNAYAFTKTIYYAALVKKARNGTWHGKHFRVQKEIDALMREFGESYIEVEYPDGETDTYKDGATAYTARFLINDVPDVPVILKASQADELMRGFIPICEERCAAAEANLADWIEENPDGKWADAYYGGEVKGQEEIIYMEEAR